MKKSEIPLIINGRRIDGRLPEELREIKMSVGEIFECRWFCSS